jgi:excisionase family DNA binding protein
MELVTLHLKLSEEDKNFLRTLIREEIQNALAAKDERLLTPKEVCTMLSITRPTLHNWTKDGKVNCSRLGSRVYYSKADVMAAMKTIMKYDRKD